MRPHPSCGSRYGSARRDDRSPQAAAYRKLYKTSRWQSMRLAQLRSQPLCERCLSQGRITPATTVHHKREHKGDVVLFFAADNLASVCKSCHDGPIHQAEVIGYSNEIGADGWPTDERHPANRLGGG